METGPAHQIHPWGTIWIHPRKTLRKILDTNPFRWILWLAMFQGILSSLSWLGFLWTRYPQQEIYFHPLTFILSLIIGGVFGIFYLYFGGWFLKVTGTWIGGKGSFIDVKCAVGWSFYPYIVSSIINIIGYFVIGNPWGALFIGFLNIVVLIWAFVLALNLIAEAHRFSAWRALGAVLIAFVILFAAIMIIALITPLLSPLFAALK